jgi:rhodanese-related sulfurtransferase
MGRFESCPRQGTLLIPWHEPPSRIDAHTPVRLIVVYCHHGICSDDTTAFPRSIGFPSVKSLQGGIDQWGEDIDPALPRYETVFSKV